MCFHSAYLQHKPPYNATHTHIGTPTLLLFKTCSASGRFPRLTRVGGGPPAHDADSECGVLVGWTSYFLGEGLWV